MQVHKIKSLCHRQKTQHLVRTSSCSLEQALHVVGDVLPSNDDEDVEYEDGDRYG